MPDRGSDTDPTPDANRVTPADDFTGDNKVVWERWAKKRTFVRALEGTYGELKDELYNQPRVYKTTDLKWKGGPQTRRLRPNPWSYEFRGVFRAEGKRARHP